MRKKEWKQTCWGRKGGTLCTAADSKMLLVYQLAKLSEAPELRRRGYQSLVFIRVVVDLALKPQSQLHLVDVHVRPRSLICRQLEELA